MPFPKTWTGASTLVYETAGNWDPSGKPGVSDNVLIDSDSWSSGPPNAPVGAETIASLIVNGSAFTFSGGGNLTVATVQFGIDDAVTNQARASNLLGVTSLTVEDCHPVYAGTITFGTSPTVTLVNGGFIASITKIGALTLVAGGPLILGLLGDVTLTAATITVQDTSFIGVLGNVDLNVTVSGTITGPGTASAFLSQLNTGGTLVVTGFGPAYKVGAGSLQVGSYRGFVGLPPLGNVENGVTYGPDGGLVGTSTVRRPLRTRGRLH